MYILPQKQSTKVCYGVNNRRRGDVVLCNAAHLASTDTLFQLVDADLGDMSQQVIQLRIVAVVLINLGRFHGVSYWALSMTVVSFTLCLRAGVDAVSPIVIILGLYIRSV